jgi:catechol 2,3-dioxygenase-like lactoylglutathione lyase family enzyme
MKRTWTIIGVRDVPRSFKWYQSMLGQRLTAPAHSAFGQLLDSDGTVLLCLHEWAVENHPSLTSPDDGTPGNGLLLFFRVDDYGAALRRARALVSQLAEEPHVNPNTRTKEFSLRDPDGYYVTISALSALERHSLASQRPNKRLQPTKARGRAAKTLGQRPRLRA